MSFCVISAMSRPTSPADHASTCSATKAGEKSADCPCARPLRLLAIVLLAVVVIAAVRQLSRQKIEPLPTVEITAHKINPNTADWPELAAMPGIGEVMAKRIIAYRQARQREMAHLADQPADHRVFRCVNDLEQISGIGPKKAATMAEYLTFDDPTTAADSDE